MWVDLGIQFWHTLVRKDVVDRTEGEHDEPEGSIRAVEAVGPVDDEADPAIEPLVLAVRVIRRMHLNTVTLLNTAG